MSKDFISTRIVLVFGHLLILFTFFSWARFSWHIENVFFMYLYSVRLRRKLSHEQIHANLAWRYLPSLKILNQLLYCCHMSNSLSIQSLTSAAIYVIFNFIPWWPYCTCDPQRKYVERKLQSSCCNIHTPVHYHQLLAFAWY